MQEYAKCATCGCYRNKEKLLSGFYCSIVCQQVYRRCLTCMKPFLSERHEAIFCSVSCKKCYVLVQTHKGKYYIG